jgi:predicted kinase
LLDPLRHLEPYAAPLRGNHPTWENGLVDLWEGEPYPHTLALLAAGDTVALRRRLWRARSEATLPILGEIRYAFALRYHDRLAAVCPFEKRFHDRVTYITDPFAFEFWDLNAILRGAIPEEEEWLLRQCHRLRMAAAHFDAGDAQTIADVSHAWSEMAHDFGDACRGWDWPRCGQSMTLMVGPSGAGKSRWARRNHDAAEVVSSDEIHVELYGDLAVDGDKAPVFAALRRRAIELLASGRSVCIDATNLRQADRLANVRLAPPDMPVRYVVVDRPMAEKEATAGWRAEKPGLLLRHEALFAQELPAILARDGLPNVTLVDLIEHEPPREAAA